MKMMVCGSVIMERMMVLRFLPLILGVPMKIFCKFEVQVYLIIHLYVRVSLTSAA